ncbi:hypothetical protein ACXC9Q_22205 [Kribbella sp. CWNU-51]
MTRTKWHDLSPRRRRVMIAGAAIEGALKAAALADLARRPPTEVNGSKTLWALAITLINAAGMVPIAYFVYGRRPRS